MVVRNLRWPICITGTAPVQTNFYNVQMEAPVLGNRLPEGHPTPRLAPGSLSLQCQHCESSTVLAGLAFCEMLSQYPQSASQGLWAVTRAGQQRFATQTLRDLLGIENFLGARLNSSETVLHETPRFAHAKLRPSTCRIQGDSRNSRASKLHTGFIPLEQLSLRTVNLFF